MDEPWVWALIIVAGLLLFGSKRMPDTARSLGRSLRIFKAETKGLMSDEPVVQPSAVAAPQPVYAAAPVDPVYATAPVAPAVPVAVPAPVPAAPGVSPTPAPAVVQQPDAQ